MLLLTDFGALSIYTTLDAFQVAQISAEGKAPKYYLDDIQLEETGTPATFYIKPNKDEWLHIDRMIIQYADAYTGTVVAGTMPSVPYNGFLGESALDGGMVYNRTSEGKVVNSATIKQHSDLMLWSGAVMQTGSDGTNTWVTVSLRFDAGIVLKPEEEDYLSITLSEDLSGLLLLRASVGGYVEDRR